MKPIILQAALMFSVAGNAIETKLEGKYEINTRTEECAGAFEISVQNECLVMEYGAAAAREFCRLNKGPKTTSRVVEVNKEKLMEYRTVVEALFNDVLTVTETVALKNKFGVTVKRVSSAATYKALKEGLVHREGVSSLEMMKAPTYQKRTCLYKTN